MAHRPPTHRTPAVRARFLEVMTECGNVTVAAAAAGVGRQSVYAWRAQDPDFAAAWQDASSLGLCRLEDRALELAMSGSEKLIMYLLSARMPERYGQRSTIDINSRHMVALERQPLDVLRAELATLIAGPAGPLVTPGQPPTIEADGLSAPLDWPSRA